MRIVELPTGPGFDEAPLSTRSLVACLAAILDQDPTALPCPSEGDPWVSLKRPLATRGLAVVPVRDPRAFSWGGWWIARFAGSDGQPAEPYVVMTGTPSGVVFAPAGTGVDGPLTVAEGWVPTRPALDLPRDATRTAGVVSAIYRAGSSEDKTTSLTTATVTRQGVDGDRYATGNGHFSTTDRIGEALTLIEAESLDRLSQVYGIDLEPGAHRRNIVTTGIDLNSLIGRTFRIGEVECFAQRLAEPCSWLQTTTPAGTLRGLVHRGGIQADVVAPGTITVGDEVVA